MHAKNFLLIALAVTIVSLSLCSPSVAGSFDETFVDGGRLIRTSKFKLPDDSAGLISNLKWYAQEAAVGDNRTWLAVDRIMEEYYFKEFILEAAGDVCEVWVAADLAWPEGDNRSAIVIDEAQLAYLVEEFETNIIPTDTAAFGTYDAHDGSESYLVDNGNVPPGYYDGDKLVILVDNIRDDSYYDPEYPIMIAGFYSPTFEYYFDRNIINLTARKWANNLGPDDSPWRGDDPDRWRPNLLDATIAHELQHLIHGDLDENENIWVNEGMAMLSEWLCGYEIDRYIVEAVQERPENSLVSWGDQGPLEIITDYGLGLFWTMYLYEQYGGDDFIRSLAGNERNGIDGVNATLTEYGFSRTFADTFRDFRIALLIDSDNATTFPPETSRRSSAPHPYLFENVDLALNLDSDNASATEGAPAWGSDYLKLNDLAPLQQFRFNGADQLVYATGWSVAADPVTGDNASVLWSGAVNGHTSWAIIDVAGGGILTFDTYYEIEEGWDFGFVQVSADSGATWESMAVDNATMEHDPNAISTIVAQLPGLTGASGGWVSLKVDLSAYSGSDVLVAFRYMTDPSSLEAGWYIDNVKLDGNLLADGTSTEYFNDITTYVPIDAGFSVALVGAIDLNGKKQYIIRNLTLDGLTNDGAAFMGWLDHYHGYAVGVVSLEVDEEFGDLYGGYEYSVGSPFEIGVGSQH
ncbi:choice-of-anchor J domain-containing protein [Thermodesulfobacteriota bacterium]